MKLSEYIGSQFGKPRGVFGSICCLVMNVINKKLYFGIVNSLDIHKDSHVLDIGYGNGNLTKLLYNRYGCRISGVDISEDMKKLATEKNIKGVLTSRIHFDIGDCCDLSFDDEFFDAIVSVNTIYFWNDTKKGLNEIFRTLKKGGIFSNAIYSKEWMNKTSYTKKGFKLFSPDEIEVLAKEIGFEDVKIISLKDGDAFVINCKK
ncbi:MAG TPA: methyltransferase domain-containing protein [Lachnospiraceae bacterium]|nr:methyltransferase domain-containing protein [Lachnospiraceae bacterium]